MEEAPARSTAPIWFFLAATIVLCGLLMASLQTGRIVVPRLGTVIRAEHPVSFWTICAVQLFFTLTALTMLAEQFPRL
jgi:hypothetical protein